MRACGARRRRELNAAVNVARRAGADPVAAGPANGADYVRGYDVCIGGRTTNLKWYENVSP